MKYKVYILLATLIWGSSFVIVKDVTNELAVLWLLAIRFLAASILLALIFIKKRKLFFKKEYIICGACFGCALFIAYYFQTIGVTDTTPGKNAFLSAPYNILVPFFAWFIGMRKPTIFNVLAAVLAIFGVGLIALDSDLSFRWGDAMTLIGAVFFAVHIVLVSRLSENKDIYVLTIWQFFVAGIIPLIGALIFEDSIQISSWGMDMWGSIAYLTIGCTAAALLFQNMGLKKVPPATGALLLSFESVFGAIFSIAMGAEVLTAKIIIGFFVMFFAVLVSEYLPQRLQKRKTAKELQTSNDI